MRIAGFCSFRLVLVTIMRISSVCFLSVHFIPAQAGIFFFVPEIPAFAGMLSLLIH